MLDHVPPLENLLFYLHNRSDRLIFCPPLTQRPLSNSNAQPVTGADSNPSPSPLGYQGSEKSTNLKLHQHPMSRGPAVLVTVAKLWMDIVCGWNCEDLHIKNVTDSGWFQLMISTGMCRNNNLIHFPMLFTDFYWSVQWDSGIIIIIKCFIYRHLSRSPYR